MTWLIGLAVTGLSFLALYLFGRRAGKDAVKADIGEANAKAAERIAAAVGQSPTNKSAVLERLRDGRKL